VIGYIRNARGGVVTEMAFLKLGEAQIVTIPGRVAARD
jgi:hypothetical protein